MHFKHTLIPMTMKWITSLLFFLFVCSSTNISNAQNSSFFQPADTLNKTRFWTVAGIGLTIYTSASIGLFQAWYKDYELVGFHSFNDLGEWNDMDKAGHLLTAHLESNLAFNGALWTGMDRRKAMWTGAGVGMLLQTTVEVMDGFSKKWGFSWSDMAFNTLGVGLFVGQEMLWQEQRILMKVSNTRPNYSKEPIYSADGDQFTTLEARAFELYGQNFFEAFLKDYNGMVVWASFNISAFAHQQKNSKFPKWLNIALGYGADDMYGGYFNDWQDEDGVGFGADPLIYQRRREYYLSLDIDLSRIKSNRPFVRTLLGAFNWIKIPAPTLEIDPRDGLRFHPFYW